MDILFVTSLILGTGSMVAPAYVWYRFVKYVEIPGKYLRNGVIFLLALLLVSLPASFLPIEIAGINITTKFIGVWMSLNIATTAVLILIFLFSRKWRMILMLTPNIMWALLWLYLAIYFKIYPIGFYMMG